MLLRSFSSLLGILGRLTDVVRSRFFSLFCLFTTEPGMSLVLLRMDRMLDLALDCELVLQTEGKDT